MSRWFRKRLVSVDLDVCLFFMVWSKFMGSLIKITCEMILLLPLLITGLQMSTVKLICAKHMWTIVYFGRLCSLIRYLCAICIRFFFVSLCTCFYGQYFILVWLNDYNYYVYIDRWKMQTFTWMNRIPHAFEKHSQKNMYICPWPNYKFCSRQLFHVVLFKSLKLWVSIFGFLFLSNQMQLTTFTLCLHFILAIKYFGV